MEDDKFKAMSDEQLVSIAHKTGVVTGEEGPAAAELYKRQKEVEKRNILLQEENITLQKQIKRAAYLAVFISAITLGFVMFQVFQHH